MTLHPFIGFVANPATDIVKVDPEGFINPRQWRVGENDVSIAVLGGSVARGLALKRQDTLITELSKAPSLSGRRIVVRNLALGGYKQPQQLMILNYLLALGQHFDIVINLDGFNEVAIPYRDNIPNGVFPFYPRSWPLWASTAQDLSSQRLIGTIALLREWRAYLAGLCTAPPLDYSASCEVTWRLLDRSLQQRIFVAREKLATAAATKQSFRTHGPRRPETNPAELFTDLTEYWRQCSLLMHQLSHNNGMRYFHFLQPNQYVTGSKPMGDEEKQVALSPQETYRYRDAVEMGYPKLAAAGEQLVAAGVNFHDLRMIYADHPEPTYVDMCCHVNPHGNTILATEIAHRIVDQLVETDLEPSSQDSR